MANTPHIDLVKPAGTDKALISVINANSDKIDSAVGGVQDALAIVCNGNTHGAITSGQFVYVRAHETLQEGLYKANSNIAANAALNSTNLTADSAGGLNALNEQIGTLNGKLNNFIPNNGSDGQLLKSNGDGTAEWSDVGAPSDAQVGTAVNAWLNNHPEATTTVQDGAISRAKLDADLKEKTDEVPALKSALNFLTDSIETCAPVNYIDGTFTGTGYAELQKSLKAGTYLFSVDNITSSDTDSSYCIIDFYNSSSTKVGGITLERGHKSECTVTLSADASVAYFYASDNYSHSTGDTFTYTNVKLYQITKLVENIETLHKTALDVNGAIISSSVVVSPTWVNRLIIDSSGQVNIYSNTQYASTEDIISVVGYTKVDIVVGVSGLTGVKIYKYDLDGNFLGYNWGTSIVAFTYTIPDGVYGIRIGYSKDSAIDLSTIGTVTLYRANPSMPKNILGKKFVYDGDSIAESRLTDYANGGAYAKLIADLTDGTYANQAVSGGHISSTANNPYYSTTSTHSVVDNLANLPTDGDLYCFEGGINDYWANIPLGTVSDTDYTGSLDINTVAGALEYIFRYAINNFVGKPIIFVIVHKIQTTFITENTRGNTFTDFHDMFVRICNKYSIPYYDAFLHSGLNGWNTVQSNNFLTAGVHGADGTHPNEAGYVRYYVPQLIDLFSANLKY